MIGWFKEFFSGMTDGQDRLSSELETVVLKLANDRDIALAKLSVMTQMNKELMDKVEHLELLVKQKDDEYELLRQDRKFLGCTHNNLIDNYDALNAKLADANARLKHMGAK